MQGEGGAESESRLIHGSHGTVHMYVRTHAWVMTIALIVQSSQKF